MIKSKITLLEVAKWFRPWGWMILSWLALSVAAGAAEFSAQMVLKDGDKTMPGKI